MHVFCRILPALTGCLLSSCLLGPRTWEYEYRKGKTALLHGTQAVPPAGLPPRVLAAIQAGNDIAGKPYKYGGGHRSFDDTGYDCSGTVSYVLRGAGQLTQPTTSSGLRKFGSAGTGKHITVYARRGHAFIEVAGLRFDTGHHGSRQGPRWTTRSRPLRGFKARHPPGL
jgi:hypothetical protein